MPIVLQCGDDGTVLTGGLAAVTLKFPSDTSIGGSAVSALGVITSSSANALSVGRQGTTTPALNVTCNVSTCVTGINITARAAAAGVDLAVTSSGTDENLRIDAKGAGTVTINGTGTGAIILARATRFKSVTVPVAAAGSTVSDAAALGAANIVHITSDGATKGVKALASVLGDFQFVINDSATACEFYAASGGTVNGLAADASIVIAASKGIFWQATAADTIIAFDLPAKATAS